MSLEVFETRVLGSGAWKRYARTALTSGTDTKLSRAERAALAASSTLTYIPNANTTGLLPGWELSTLTPVGDGNPIVLGTTAHANKIFWGQVNPSSTSGSSMSNCAIAGPRPDLSIDDSTGGLRVTNGTTIKQWTATDCVFNSLLWTMPELNPPGGAWDIDEALFLLRNTIAIRGGRGTITNCEITNFQDGAHIAPIWNAGDTNATNFTKFTHCWIHKILFYKGAGHNQPEGTHSDGIQFHYGRNTTIEFSLLGGQVDPVGYAADPSYNSGEGAYNSLVMLQQELNNTDTYRVENVDINECILWSGSPEGYCINHHYDSSTSSHPERENLMTGSTIRNNKFVQRGDGHYVIRNPVYSPLYSNNSIIIPDGNGSWSTVGPVTFTNGV